MSYTEIRRFRLANNFYLLAFAACLVNLVDVAFLGIKDWLFLSHFFVSFIPLLLYYLNRFEHLRKVLLDVFLLIACLWIFLNATIFGDNSGVQYFYFPTLIFLFLLIDNKDKTRLIFFTTLIVVSIFALELINYKLFTEIIIEENKIRVKYFVIIAITMMQTVLASNYMVNVADKNEEMLESEKQELASVNNNLDQLNNYIDQQNLFLKNELQQKTVELLEQQKNLNRALIAAEEKERKRLSRDLHDGLGLLLSTAKIKIQTFDLKNVEQNESLVEALELIDKSCIELRLISQNLTPTLISEIGLAASLEAIVGNINTSKFTQIELVIVGIEYIKWKSEDEVKVYRLILELINNCIKHANADLITVQIIYKNELLRLLVEDNGEGFSNKGIILGNGLKNTKAIVELFNGTIKIESNHKKGALIYIEIPYV